MLFVPLFVKFGDVAADYIQVRDHANMHQAHMELISILSFFHFYLTSVFPA